MGTPAYDPAMGELLHAPAYVPVDENTFTDIAFWLRPADEREGAFRWLRDHEPVKFVNEGLVPGFPQGPGFWAVTRYDDVWHASRNPQLFCSGRGTNIPDLPIEIAEFFGSMINMDDPKHFRLRSIVSKGFTPKEIARVESYVKSVAAGIVDDLLERFPERTCDFVEQIAAPLPLRIICEMMGIPKSDEAQIFAWTNVILGAGDPDYGGTFEHLLTESLAMYQYAIELGQDRLDHPTDDLTSVLMHAVVDGERLTTQEFASFFILLVVAGNETTRNAISHGMRMLTLLPDQKRTWFGDFETHTRSAVEEIVRWASPVIHFRRTATADTELGGQAIKAGDKVVLWYNSANRDERTFAQPYVFDVTRQPNAQAGFGAGGPHFCLGANLARREIAVMFDEIRRRLPDLAITGEPAMLQSAFIHGIKRMPCAW
jgi:cytochrome P450